MTCRVRRGWSRVLLVAGTIALCVSTARHVMLTYWLKRPRPEAAPKRPAYDAKRKVCGLSPSSDGSLVLGVATEPIAAGQMAEVNLTTGQVRSMRDGEPWPTCSQCGGPRLAELCVTYAVPQEGCPGHVERHQV